MNLVSDRQPGRYAETTEQNLVVHIAVVNLKKVTNNKRLCSMLLYRQEASRGLSATAELLVINAGPFRQHQPDCS